MNSSFSMMLALALLSSPEALASLPEPLWVAEPTPSREQAASPTAAPRPAGPSASQSRAPQPRAPHPASNLPAELLSRDFSRLEQTSVAIVRPDPNLKSGLPGLKVGDVLIARVPHSVIAFPDEKAPVLAYVETPGAAKDLRLLGFSRLEPNSHRILIEFAVGAVHGKQYKFKGTALTKEGATGFMGEYHSREAEYFAGDFLSSMVAAYFDGLIPRSTNPWGQVQADNSVDSSFKKGIAGGAMASAERFKEKLKKVPEFSELEGPTEIRVIVVEEGRG